MKKYSQVILSITIAIIFLIGYPAEALAEGSWLQNFLAYIGFKRDVRGKVGSRPKGGGGRGNCPNLAYLNKAKDLQLIAIIPEAQPYSSSSLASKPAKITWSYTIQQRPNLWFYVPYKFDEETQVKFAKLALIDEDKRLITQPPFIFQLPQQPGIVQVKLPIALEVNKPYKWFFSVICDDNKPSRNPSVSGWVQRVPPNQAGFVLQPSEDVFNRINYRDIANYGLWFDAFTRLAEVYQLSNPQNSIDSSVNSENFTKTKSLDNQIQEDWLAVFKGLELDDENIISEISQAPIFKLNCVSKTDGSKCE
ncbi:MAG: DUF928 domain-containing protein [Scytonema sp. RU_4_4]|nr:DUF928 domain-containing protein [Scytonema sp. RU_4_4]